MEATASIKRRIATYIIMAQISSDSGKRIRQSNLTQCVKSKGLVKQSIEGGYRLKDVYIRKACELISRYKNSGFRFACHDGGITSSLFYFEFKQNGNKLQVSFHNLEEQELWKKASKESHIRWDHLDSRKSCIILAERFGV